MNTQQLSALATTLLAGDITPHEALRLLFNAEPAWTYREYYELAGFIIDRTTVYAFLSMHLAYSIPTE